MRRILFSFSLLFIFVVPPARADDCNGRRYYYRSSGMHCRFEAAAADVGAAAIRVVGGAILVGATRVAYGAVLPQAPPHPQSGGVYGGGSCAPDDISCRVARARREARRAARIRAAEEAERRAYSEAFERELERYR